MVKTKLGITKYLSVPGTEILQVNNEVGVDLPEIIDQIEMEKVPDFIWSLVKGDDIRDVTDDSFINNYTYRGRQKIKEISNRRRVAIDALKRKTSNNAIRLGRLGSNIAAFELLRIDYINERQMILSGDFYHANTQTGGSLIYPEGTRSHCILNCKVCKEEAVRDCDAQNYYHNNHKSTWVMLNKAITVANLALLIGLLMMLPRAEAVSNDRNLSDSVFFHAFDCGQPKDVRILADGRNCFKREDRPNENKTVTLLTRVPSLPFQGFRCHMRRTTSFVLCGWDSTQSILRPDKSNILHIVPAMECAEMAHSKRILLGRDFIDIPANGIVVHSYLMAGQTTHRGSVITCVGETIKLNGQIDRSVILYVQDTIQVDPVSLSLSTNDFQIKDLTNRARLKKCTVGSMHCL